MIYQKCSRKSIRQQSGVTLIEVLIASLILFMAIGLSATIFRQNALLQNKAIQQLNLAELEHDARPYIEFDMENGILSGTVNQLAAGIEWQAVLQSKTAYFGGYSEEGNATNRDGHFLAIYHVQAKSSIGNFSFKVMQWQK